MNKSLLLGFRKSLARVPRFIWQREAARSARSNQARLSFMSEDHQRVRDFAVLELARRGSPISPADIANNLNLPLPRILEILDELEAGMTFLFRNAKGAVAWAYPVTAEPTPHRIRLNTGEQTYAA
jgi:hypothetical protein